MLPRGAGGGATSSDSHGEMWKPGAGQRLHMGRFGSLLQLGRHMFDANQSISNADAKHVNHKNQKK